MIDFVELLEDADDDDLARINPLPSTKSFIDFLRRRALDESVFVRKNALQVLENVLKCSVSGEMLSEDLVMILGEHCRDSSLMVRKQMVSSLTELLKKYCENEMVIKHWVDGLFPLILDVEQKCAEKVHEVIYFFVVVIAIKLLSPRIESNAFIAVHLGVLVRQSGKKRFR